MLLKLGGEAGYPGLGKGKLETKRWERIFVFHFLQQLQVKETFLRKGSAYNTAKVEECQFLEGFHRKSCDSNMAEKGVKVLSILLVSGSNPVATAKTVGMPIPW